LTHKVRFKLLVIISHFIPEKTHSPLIIIHALLLLHLGILETSEPEYGSPPTDVIIHVTNCPTVSRAITTDLPATAKSVGITAINKAERLMLGLRRHLFRCKKEEIIFKIVAHPSALPEVQACRLVQYLCSFDPQIKPLLTVIRYWAKVNEIYLVESHGGRSHAPDLAALDWLVIFFLCHKKKMLPTPRHIQERPHTKLIANGIDVGFFADPSFVQEFKQNPYKEVGGAGVQPFNIFKLAKQFFEFYNHNRKLVLNTKDGEIIPMEQFVGDITTIETKLSEEERELAKKVHPGDNPGHLILPHPLYLKSGIACFDRNYVSSVVPAMKVTRDKIENAFNKYSRKKDESDLDFRSALMVN